NRSDTFVFGYSKHPDLINVDADKVLLCEKTDNKSFLNYVHQIKYAPKYLDRKEALDYFKKQGFQELSLGLNDNYAPLRTYAIDALTNSKFVTDEFVVKRIEDIASTEQNKKTLAAALNFLVKKNDAKYLPVFTKNVNDSSYSVAGAALAGLAALQPDKAYE